MVFSALRRLRARVSRSQAAVPDLAELGLLDPAVARHLRASGVELEHFAATLSGHAASSDPEALPSPLRLLLPLAPAADSLWLDQAWMLLRAHGLQLELVPPAVATGEPASASARRGALAACDLVVLPCWQAGSLAAVVEAAAMARPLICVDTPEAHELIRHGRDGLLVPAGNAQALQLAVQLLVRQPSFMQELGQNAQRKVVAAYQLADDLQRTLETYQRLLPLGQGNQQHPH